MFDKLRKNLWVGVLIVVLFLMIVLVLLISFPAVGRLDVSYRKDLIAVTVSSSGYMSSSDYISSSDYNSGALTVDMECKKIREGCEHIVSRLGKGGFTTEEYNSWTEFEKECISTGCLEWGESKREFVSLKLSSEEVSAIANEFKASAIPLSDIKVKFENGKILASGASSFPFAIGNINGEGEIVTGNYIKINKLYLGMIPIPQKYIDYFEKGGNEYLQGTFAQYYIIMETMQVEDNKLAINAYVPKGSIKRVNDKLILNLQKIPEVPEEGDFRIQ